MDTFAQRIFTRPELLGHRLTHHDDGWGIGPIRLQDASSAQERQPQICNHPGPYVVAPRDRGVTESLDEQSFGNHGLEAERQPGPVRAPRLCPFDAGKLFDATRQFGGRLGHRSSVQIAAGREAHPHAQDVFRDESRVGRPKCLEASHQKGGGSQKYRGRGDLEQNQAAAQPITFSVSHVSRATRERAA